MKKSFLESNEEEVKEYLGRYRTLYIVLACMAVIIGIRIFYLQIIVGSEMRQFSEKNRVKEAKISAPRGLILDRNGQVLVENLPGFYVTLSPQYVSKLDVTAQALSPVLNIPPEKIMSDVYRSRRRDGPFRSVKLKDNVSLDEVVALKLLRWDNPGLNINQNVLRYYPLKENGAQLFGYVGEISREQLPKFNKRFQGLVNFEQGDTVGQSGLEETLEKFIRGHDGIQYVEVDVRGREIISDKPRHLGLKDEKAVSGHTIELTIDKDIQEAAYKAMHRDDKIGNRIGGVIAMKSDGEILAWVNTPSFDPNDFSTGISPTLWGSLINHPFKPLRNKAIQDHFSPGSTFKPIVAIAALQEKVITPTTLINAPSQFKFGRRVYHDHTKTGQGNITVFEALERSSNVFFYKMGIALGIDKIALYAKALGLGARTGINVPNEVSGLIPTSEWKLKVMGEEWQPGENLSNAIGQGFILATALQMALAYNTIGLEGPVVKPYVVRKILNQEQHVIEEFHPQVIRDLSDPQNPSGVFIDKKNFRTVKEGMRRVANGERGTAKWWKVPGIEMAGKTGTTQLMSFSSDDIYSICERRPLHQRHHGWYVAFAPAENPKITVAVLAEHACHGNTGAAPIVRDVMQAYFEKYYPDMILKKGEKEKAHKEPAQPVETSE